MYGQGSCRQSQTEEEEEEKQRKQSICKVESQSPITRPVLICLENVTCLLGGGWRHRIPNSHPNSYWLKGMMTANRGDDMEKKISFFF